MAYLYVKNLWKIYDQQVVLENVNLKVDVGEFVSIVGPSGCGKTTFLRLLLGMESPSRGFIHLEGKPLLAEPGKDRGIVFQRYTLFPHLRVLANLRMGLEFQKNKWFGRLTGSSLRQANLQAEEMLEAIGLSHARNLYPHQLSGGMQQRLSIAQSVICKPKILLLDEPFGALDPGITEDMYKLVGDMWKDHHLTIFMVTHNIKEGFRLGNRVVVFDKVRLDENDPRAYGATITHDIPFRRSIPRYIVESIYRGRQTSLFLDKHQ